jgi:ABC-type multidrug transport system fused ATPase/permease subunit
VFKTLKGLWKLLTPFHRDFYIYIVKITLYESIQLLDNSTISIIVLLLENQSSPLTWGLALGAMLLFNEINMRGDNAVDWHIVSRQGYPLYGYLKTLALKKFLALDIPWHHSNNSGTLVGKVHSGVSKTQDLADNLSWEFIPTLIQMIISLIPLTVISWPSTLICLASAIIFMKLSIKSYNVRSPLKKQRHDLYEQEWHTGIETVQSIETVQIYVQQSNIEKSYEQTHDEIIRLGLEDAELGIYTYNRHRIRLLTMARVLILAFWVFQFYGGGMSVAVLIFAHTLTVRLFHSFWRFARIFERAQESAESINRLVELMNQEPTIVNSPDAQYPATMNPPHIRFQNVCFSYQGSYDKNVGALHNLSFDIESGTTVALVGPSGSGKTTIRKLIGRSMDIHSGSILIDGIDIREWDIDTLRSLNAQVPQGEDVAIFDASIGNNIAFGKPDACPEEIQEAAKLAGIHDFIVALPEGYETIVGEKGHKLSGGQKQRVALARAILADCWILSFDEATNALDAITEHEIQQKMKDILKNKTAIIIAHRLATIWDIADKIIVLENGIVVEEGNHDELMANQGLYSRMVELQKMNN